MSNSQNFSIEDIARFPLPGMAIPGALAFNPDDRLVTYLLSPDGGLTRLLYAFDIQTGAHTLALHPPGEGVTEENISIEEKLRRERMRQVELGITSYTWSPDGQMILIPLPDGLYLCRLALGAPTEKATLRRLVSAEKGPLIDPQFSPDGCWVAYVQRNELFAAPVDGGAPVQLTTGASETCFHGLAEYIAQEEMGRRRGFWWSPDSKSIAFTEVDESHIPVYRIVHQGKDITGPAAQEDHRYPFAGQPNAGVRLGVVKLTNPGEPAWIDLGPDEDIYLARVGWFPDGSLGVQRENRVQDTLDLLRGNPHTGEAVLLLRETSDIWINLHDFFRPLKSPAFQGAFLWGSERSGFRHLYLVDRDGNIVRPLTAGEWMVDSLAGVDEDHGLVYFTASKETPTECHLYVAPLSGGEPRRLTIEPGMHSVVLGHECKHFVDTHDALDQPPRVTLCSLEDGSLLATLFKPRDPRLETIALQPPEIVSFHNRGGDLLYGMVYRPPAEFGAGPYPTIVQVYGGPHAQQVTNSWVRTISMRAQHLRRLGFLVFILDNRGSARRGLAFEGAIKHHLGTVEVQDQQDGVRWLAAQGLADPQRVGIYGWSYGGFMALMCLARASDTFHAAVAGAPVTAWDGYDTHYTERYMGTPQANPTGYVDSMVMTHLDKIRGRLLLVHGLIDENVHFRHTARLINAFIRQRRTYEMLVFPDERHLPRHIVDRVYMEEQIRDFFLNAL